MRINIDEKKYMSNLARGILEHLKRFLEEEGLEKTTLVAEFDIGDKQRVDFAFPNLKEKVFIEVHGQQHFKIVDHWGGAKGLQKRKLLDRHKKEMLDVMFPDSLLIEFGFKPVSYDEFLFTMGESLERIKKEDIIEIINEKIEQETVKTIKRTFEKKEIRNRMIETEEPKKRKRLSINEDEFIQIKRKGRTICKEW